MRRPRPRADRADGERDRRRGRHRGHRGRRRLDAGRRLRPWSRTPRARSVASTRSSRTRASTPSSGRTSRDWDVAEFDRILATNLRGPFLVARAAIPHMLDAGGGSIVHMSSVCAITVWAGDCALRRLEGRPEHAVRPHRSRVRGARHRFDTLMPGVIRTELHESATEAMQDDRAFERELLGRHPIGRFGTGRGRRRRLRLPVRGRGPVPDRRQHLDRRRLLSHLR